MKLTYAPYSLEFKRPFSIAHGSRNSTPVVFTRVEYEGMIGYGEASMPPYLGENHSTALSFLAASKRVFTRFSDPLNITVILSEIDKIEKGNTAAKASIDIALNDLLGKIHNKSCHELFAADKGKNIFTAYTIPMDTPDGIRQRIEEAAEYKILKVKLGSSDDKKSIEEIRKLTMKPLIVDANEGWSDVSAALEMVQWLAKRDVLLVEQPMPKERTEEISWLTSQSPVPIMADEAIQRLSDLEKIKGVYSGINIKLMKCTGLQEAHKMIMQAREYNMKIMMGCMSETSCGVSAAAQLAPLVDWVDLDGPLLLKKDYFEGVKFSEGRIILNDSPGIGVKPCADFF